MKMAGDFEATATVEAEAALIGCLMQNNRAIDGAADRVSPDDFAEPAMGRVFSAILREHGLGRNANPVTLKPYFENDEALKELGGMGFLAQLTGASLPIGANDLASQVRELAQRRRLVAGLQETIARADDWETSIEELISDTDKAIAEAVDSNEGIHQPTAAECIEEVLAGFGKADSGVSCVSVPTIDRLIGPAKPKQLIILAARPGMGKTACALSYAIGAAREGHGVLFVSLEMSSTELGARMAADMCFDGQGGVEFAAINSAQANIDQQREVARAALEMRELPFRVIDIGSVQIGRLGMIVRRHARRMAAQGKKLELVIVDYLQLVRPDHRTSSAYEAVSEVSRGLKAMAKTNGVAVMALAQLSREVEKRADKLPQLSDLRDSGQIEQDADAVMFLMRPEYYLKKEEPSASDPNRLEWERAMSEVRNRLKFICAKRRNGPDGIGEGYFFGQFQAVRG
jgi:replicative DNA helicase